MAKEGAQHEHHFTLSRSPGGKIIQSRTLDKIPPIKPKVKEVFMKTLKFVGRLLKKCLIIPIFLCCPTACLTRQEMEEIGVDLSGQGRN